MLGIVPAAGRSTRIQLLASSNELLLIGEQSRAVAAYVLERLVCAGADKICLVVGAGNSELANYFGAHFAGVDLLYVVQPEPLGLCDALFRASAMVDADEQVAVGLPDTVWFPEHALAGLPDDALSFLLFPVEHPELFDAVLLDDRDQVLEVRVQRRDPGTEWIWGAFKMPGRVFRDLHALWSARECRDEYVGTLVNAYLAAGGSALGRKAGESYMDVGTMHGYFDALLMLGEPASGRALNS
jgi:dTDP-glucose pyrophosphorylase